MNNPIARLLGQAEVNLSDLSRRAVASVADPIKAKGQEVVSDVVGAATGALKVVAIKAALGLVAGIMLVVAIVYAIAALYWYLLPILGPVEARLVLAGMFLLVAIVAGLAMVFLPTGSGAAAAKAKTEAAKVAAKTDARRAMVDAEAASAAAGQAASAQGSNLDLKSGVETLASILGDAGYRREQAGLRTGMALASQLKPVQIVSLALIGGYIAGLRYMARRR